MEIIEIIKQDYQYFPLNQTYSIYASDIYFKDPLNEFKGIERYQKMIGFMGNWFKKIQLDLHNIYLDGKTIHTKWTLNWTTPLPWNPRISIPGRSELKLNEDNLIVSHVDYWDCSGFDVIKQHFVFKS